MQLFNEQTENKPAKNVNYILKKNSLTQVTPERCVILPTFSQSITQNIPAILTVNPPFAIETTASRTYKRKIYRRKKQET